MKTMYQRILALGLCLTLALGCVGLVHADSEGRDDAAAANPGQSAGEAASAREPVEDSESVYVLTDASGSVEKLIVSERRGEADGEAHSVQSEQDKALPVELRFHYRLNGEEIAPEELAGKSGSVEIRIDYTNLAAGTKVIDGQEQSLYVPFLALSALLLDNERFSELRVENGKALNDGSRTVVVGYALPGLEQSLALPEELELSIPDHVTITAEVKDFSLGSVYTLVANNLLRDYDGSDPKALQSLLDSADALRRAMDQLLDGAAALNDGLETLLSKSGALAEGVDALRGGAEQLSAGADRLCDGAASLSDGAGALQGGTAKLAAGASELRGGAERLSGGAAQLSAGLDQLSANSAALNDGAQTVFLSLLSTAETQLRANGLELPTLSIANYQTVLNQIIAGLDHDAVYAQALAQVTAAVEARRAEIEALVTAAAREQVTAAVSAAVRQNVEEQVRQSVSAAVRAQVVQAATGMSLEQYEAAVAAGAIDEAAQAAIEAQIAAALSSDEVLAQIEQTVQQTMASDEIAATIGQNVQAQMASDEIQSAIAANTEAQVQKAIADAMAGDEVQAKLAAAAEGAQAVIALKTSLDQYNGFYLGLRSYTAGVDAAAQGASTLDQGAKALSSGAASLAKGGAELSAGTDTLAQGAEALAGGTKELSAGAKRLADGARALQDNVPALIDGVRRLRDGSGELKNGLCRLDAEGIQKLERLIRVDAEGILDRLQALAELGRDYNAAYTGLPAEEAQELRFIYRSAAIGE